MLVHQYVALRDLTVQDASGAQSLLHRGDLIPMELSDKWTPRGITALINTKRIEVSMAAQARAEAAVEDGQQAKRKYSKKN